MLTVVFFRTRAGREPTREWLRDLQREERQVIGEDLQTVQFGFPLGMPLCRSLGRGLFELRSTLPSRKEARLLFFQTGSELIILHGFIKRTQKTPRTEIDLATARKREFERGLG